MAIPRVFVSSTYYDLKHLRSSLEVFVESLGYDAVLSEKGSIAYSPDQPLDESCYREVKACDVYVLIIGGRYGSEASETRTQTPKSFFERYESVTKMEYNAAIEEDVPIYILVERAVYAEYQTFLKNRERKDVVYAHVDSANVFLFIEAILTQPRNNPVQTFDRYEEIEEWLKLQWAGLFRELLKQKSNQAQLVGLAAQVRDLSEVNKTLRRYLEQVVTKVTPQEASSLIKSEEARLADARILARLERNHYVNYITRGDVPPIESVRRALADSKSLDDFLRRAEEAGADLSRLRVVQRSSAALRDLNLAREIVGKEPFSAKEAGLPAEFAEAAPFDREPTLIKTPTVSPERAKRRTKKKVDATPRRKKRIAKK